VADRAGRAAPRGFHASLEVAPPIVGDLDLRRRDGSAVLPEDVKEDDQIAGSPVKHSVELPPDMAPKFSELPFDLRAVRERKVRIGGIQHVEPINLMVKNRLPSGVQAINEVADWLRTVGCAVVDRLKVRHGRIVAVVADALFASSTAAVLV
jgi:hypothetical protein